jgi:putative tricarboxylic transport membrane protein
MIRVRSQQDLVGGLALVALAGLVLYLIQDLPIGRATRMGPAYVPTLLAYGMGMLGAVLALRSLFMGNDAIEAWSFKRLGIVLGALIVFGLTLRPLGLAIAAFLLTFISSFAASDAKWKESAPFCAALVVFAVAVFIQGLGMPLSILPRAWL